MVAVPPPRLSRTTATDPFAIGFVHTSELPLVDSRLPCRPPQSWFTPMTSVFVRIAFVAELIVRMSLPAISGAFSSAQRLKWACDSVSDSPCPTSSMSGSFHAPGPDADAYPGCWSRMLITEFQLPWMSPVSRQELPVAAPQDLTLSLPQLQIAYRIARPVLASASRMAAYRFGPLIPFCWPQLSYLR